MRKVGYVDPQEECGCRLVMSNRVRGGESEGFLEGGAGSGTWMSQEVSKWLVNGLQPTYKWGMLGL